MNQHRQMPWLRRDLFTSLPLSIPRAFLAFEPQKSCPCDNVRFTYAGPGFVRMYPSLRPNAAARCHGCASRPARRTNGQYPLVRGSFTRYRSPSSASLHTRPEPASSHEYVCSARLKHCCDSPCETFCIMHSYSTIDLGVASSCV